MHQFLTELQDTIKCRYIVPWKTDKFLVKKKKYILTYAFVLINKTKTEYKR